MGCLWVYGPKFSDGKIFLGDSGAYTVGHLLVWVIIILVNSDNDVSPFAIFLMFFGRWLILVQQWRRWKLGSPASHLDELLPSAHCAFLEIRFLVE